MTDEAQNQKRRIIIHAPDKKREITVHDFIPATDLLLEDAKCIIAAELSQYRSKVKRGVTLDLKEARVIQGYLDALTRLQKEEREQARSEDLSNLSNDELLQLAQQLFGSKKLLEPSSND